MDTLFLEVTFDNIDCTGKLSWPWAFESNFYVMRTKWRDKTIPSFTRDIRKKRTDYQIHSEHSHFYNFDSLRRTELYGINNVHMSSQQTCYVAKTTIRIFHPALTVTAVSSLWNLTTLLFLARCIILLLPELSTQRVTTHPNAVIEVKHKPIEIQESVLSHTSQIDFKLTNMPPKLHGPMWLT